MWRWICCGEEDDIGYFSVARCERKGQYVSTRGKALRLGKRHEKQCPFRGMVELEQKRKKK